MRTSAASGPTLVLASSSPRRQELIARLGLPVVIMPSLTDEDTPDHWTPSQIVEGLSLRKALAVSEKLHPETDAASIVVGSDTIVVLDGTPMGKPRDAEDAEAMLAQLSGQAHEVYTGVTCVRVADGKTATSHLVTKVRMRQLTREQIARYVASGEPMDKAGAYGVQGLGSLLVESIEGCFFNVVGLPVSHLAVQLEQFGVTIP